MSMENELLDLARRNADEAEVYSLTYEETPVSFEANRLKSILSRQSHGVALRIIRNGHIGFAAGTGVENPRDLLEIALESAPFGAEARFHMPPGATYPTVDAYDPAVEALSLESMTQAGQSLIDRVVAHTDGIVCEASLVKRVSTTRLLNSEGASATSKKTTFSARIEGTLIRGTDMLFVGDVSASCNATLDLSILADQTIHQLELAKDAVPAPRGEVPVIFTPRGFAQAFSTPLSLGLSGKTVLQGSSPLGHLLDQPCFDRRFTLVDDPTISFRPGSRPADDEGVPTQRRVLVEGGTLKHFVYDLQTAGMAGTHSTGNASRGLATLPSPDISVMVVEPGDVPFEQMVADIKEGIVVEQMLGSSQGNVLGGDFSGNVLLGYKIERGRIIGRVKDTMVAGNVYAILKSIEALGREARWVGGSLFLPPIACKNVTVSTGG